jgi:hypothetical protein
MERAWLFDTVCVTVAEVDFVDPAQRFEPSARERGVRVEIRPTAAGPAVGTVYASDPIALQAAVCRIDLLESRPGAADRMHWHPVMISGEPGDRTFDAALSADPVGWLADRLHDMTSLSSGAPAEVATLLTHDAGAVAGVADEIVAAVSAGLENCRRPWPDVAHDQRGMAIPSR